MVLEIKRAQPRKRRPIIGPPQTPDGINSTQRLHQRRTSPSGIDGEVDVLHRPQQRMIHPRFGKHRQQPAAPRQGNTDLDQTPRRHHSSGSDHTDHRVGPAQPLMQPLVPLIPHRDPITQILIQEHLVTLSNQPPTQLTGTLTVLAGMADEYPGHRPSQASVKQHPTNRSKLMTLTSPIHGCDHRVVSLALPFC